MYIASHIDIHTYIQGGIGPTYPLPAPPPGQEDAPSGDAPMAAAEAAPAADASAAVEAAFEAAPEAGALGFKEPMWVAWGGSSYGSINVRL